MANPVKMFVININVSIIFHINPFVQLIKVYLDYTELPIIDRTLKDVKAL
jgi:hypothetical protein